MLYPVWEHFLTIWRLGNEIGDNASIPVEAALDALVRYLEQLKETRGDSASWMSEVCQKIRDWRNQNDALLRRGGTHHPTGLIADEFL